ncbi:hypothetical protein SELMODRAFT_268522 [Selaginella moellendorffii]|uniref:CBS domain-containing protein n=1 Tax=Selaginella moellendorffii TaxID=88036 RepID=D8SF34_SELML|nr:CBS domain-containing protein CBSX5 [Selaginella moellendorffii]XP_024515654.1 CBS domain-containing protein CBSX5 [Selaginella moellendorffii]EFJ12895.1 hypothetical protein SELMODRAFT_271819 [Selaginella moellendorffii]EFJ17089.1 hypothetical protein SELMODRAFT_268522 [Selaginella moellendorffii]|eukprot:XP_002981996.1 CBS domain-containing protein CBSX5 [Selaginella moellendorffii]
MADFFHTFGAADLALGKPGIYGLPITSTVGDALCMLRDLGLAEITVWDCASDQRCEARIRKWECRECQCVGKVNSLDILCYYAAQDKVHSIEAAAKDPVSVLLTPAKRSQIRHVDLHARLTDAFNLILDGAQCFIVPLDNRRSKSLKLSSLALRKSTSTAAAAAVAIETYKRMDFCWLTQEDVLRFLLGCIGVFSPIPMMSIEELGIIDRDVMFVDANAKASDALPLMIRASQQMSAVAVVEADYSSDGDEGLKIVGDISLASLGSCCDETAALALASLSVADFMTYVQDIAGAPQSLKELILSGLEAKTSKDLSYERVKLGMAIDSSFSDSDTSSSSSGSVLDSSLSDDETASTGSIPRGRTNSAKFQRACPPWSSPLCCHPWSSLVAVMAQALAFRRTYLWVTDEEHMLIGMVTYLDMIRVLLKA